MESKIKIGSSLKRRRTALGISVYRVAIDLAMQESQIKAIERATSNYTIESLLAYQNYLTAKEK